MQTRLRMGEHARGDDRGSRWEPEPAFGKTTSAAPPHPTFRATTARPSKAKSTARTKAQKAARKRQRK